MIALGRVGNDDSRTGGGWWGDYVARYSVRERYAVLSTCDSCFSRGTLVNELRQEPGALFTVRGVRVFFWGAVLLVLFLVFQANVVPLPWVDVLFEERGP